MYVSVECLDSIGERFSILNGGILVGSNIYLHHRLAVREGFKVGLDFILQLGGSNINLFIDFGLRKKEQKQFWKKKRKKKGKIRKKK